MRNSKMLLSLTVTALIVGLLISFPQSEPIPITAYAQVGYGAPAPSGGAVAPAPTGPSSTEINTNPEGTAPSLLEASASTAATSLLGATTEAASQAVEAMGETDPTQTAEVVAQMVLSDPVTTTTVIETIVESNPTAAAQIVENLIVNHPTQATAILNRMTVTGAANLILAIFGLPTTPSKAADALAAMSTTKAAQTVTSLIAQGYTSQVAEIFNYLTTTKLNDIFKKLTSEDKTTLLTYLTRETLAKIALENMPSAAVAAKTEALTIGAGVTATVNHQAETGVTLQVTAKTAAAGQITTEKYLTTPQTAYKPDWLDIRKYIQVTTTIPTDQLSEIKLTIHYTDTEMYRMIEPTLKIYKYDPETLTWTPVATTLNEADNTATATLTGLSIFAIGGVDP